MLILLWWFCGVSITSCNELVSVVAVFRHGDRNPYTTYKTDPYKDESHWVEGPGQLTKRGMQRQFDLGLWLRDRYNDFLPPRYSSKNIKVISTDVDRTLMSAELVLAALYQPQTTDKFNEDINWQPIPIHTTPQHLDPLLAMKKTCNKYERLFHDLINSKAIKQFNDNNRDLYSFLTRRTGENVSTFYDVEVIHNTLHTQFLANKTLPAWTLEVYPRALRQAVALRYRFPCYNKELARLQIGLFFGEVIKHFQNRIEGNPPLALLFSAHDSTVASILTTIQAFNDEVPPYSSSVIFELRRNESRNYFVNILFKNTSGLHEILAEPCGFNCAFEEFKQIFKPVVVDNVTRWERECEN